MNAACSSGSEGMVQLSCSKTPQQSGNTTDRTAATSALVGLAGWLTLVMPSVAYTQDASLVVDVNVAVAPSCSITPTARSVDLGELSRPGAVTLSVGFSCNSYFQFVLSSTHRGLKHFSWMPVRPPFVSLVPYAVSYTVGTSGGLLVGQCSSNKMVLGASTCRGASSPDATAIDQTATLVLSWGLTGQYPVAGVYHDTLNINVSAGL
jgi:hypothetical protein